MKSQWLSLFISAALVSSSFALAEGQRPIAPNKPKKPELADAVVGNYAGDVISDSHGSSKNKVTVKVVKKGSTTVLVTSDYARLGAVIVPLELMSNRMIIAASGKATFVYDPTKHPIRLDYSPDGSVAYAGIKQ